MMLSDVNVEKRRLVENLEREPALLESANAFLPAIVRKWLATGEASSALNDPDEGVIVVKKCCGCVVFSDASGFTKLTEQLAKKQNGAECLSLGLNAFFTPLIETIEAYRGDVIKFSGDALTILFPLDEGQEHNISLDLLQRYQRDSDNPEDGLLSPMGVACLRAASSCLEIQKLYQPGKFKPDPSIDVTLCLHIGVGAGEVTLIAVGGDKQRHEYVLAGQPLEQISIAEPLAASGETVFSPEAWEPINHVAVEGHKIPAPDEKFRVLGGLDTTYHTYPTVKRAAQNATKKLKLIRALRSKRIPRNEVFQQTLKFIPRAAWKKFQPGMAASVNEIRMVSIIFIQMGGIDVSSDSGINTAQELMRCVQEECYAQEGHLNKFLVDDKGILFLLVFGLPPLVHIDDPARAVNFCLSCSKQLKSMHVHARFGVTTGHAFCGIVGSDRRCEYTVMGDTVNISARLMGNAPADGVLIDQATYNRCLDSEEINCKVLEPILVKGKQHPIPIFQPEIGFRESEKKKRRDWKVLLPPASEGDLDTPLPQEITVHVPLRCITHYFGGDSALIQVKRWKELQSVTELFGGIGCISSALEAQKSAKLNKKNDFKGTNSKLSRGSLKKQTNNFNKTGGIIVLSGPAGNGKAELCEFVVHAALQRRPHAYVPVFASLHASIDDPFIPFRELLDCLADALKPGKQKATTLFSFFQKQDQDVLRDLGYIQEGFMKLSSRSVNKASMNEEQAYQRIIDAIITFIKNSVLPKFPLFVMLSIRQGTSHSVADASAFWALAHALSKLADDNRFNLEHESKQFLGVQKTKTMFNKQKSAGKAAKESGSGSADIPSQQSTMSCGNAQVPKLQSELSGHPFIVLIRCRDSLERDSTTSDEREIATFASLTNSCFHFAILTDDAVLEYLCRLLQLPQNSMKSVPMKLLQFIKEVTDHTPRHIQETIQVLLRDGWVKVNNDQISLYTSDMTQVNIQDWTHTSLIGGTISRIESLDLAKQLVIKVATVFEGPFSTFDLVAASRLYHTGSLQPSDQIPLLIAVKWLLENNFVFTYECDEEESDKSFDGAPLSVPRFQLVNPLLRKVAGSLLLHSQRIAVKRAVLMSRAIYVLLPVRLRHCEKKAKALQGIGEHWNPERENKELWAGTHNGTEFELDQIGSGETSALRSEVGAPVSIKCTLARVGCVQNDAMSPNELDNRLLMACADGDYQKVTQYLHEGASVCTLDRLGRSALHFAAANGHEGIIRMLLKHIMAIAEEGLISLPVDGETPLMTAAVHGQLGALKVFRELVPLDDQANMQIWEPLSWKDWDRMLRPIRHEDEIPVCSPPNEGDMDSFFNLNTRTSQSLSNSQERRVLVRRWFRTELTRHELFQSSQTEEPDSGTSPVAKGGAKKKQTDQSGGGSKFGAEVSTLSRHSAHFSGITAKGLAPRRVSIGNQEIEDNAVQKSLNPKPSPKPMTNKTSQLLRTTSTRGKSLEMDEDANDDAELPDESFIGKKVVALRSYLQSTTWYRSQHARNMRKFVRGNFFKTLLTFALFAALFLPDVFILLEVPSDIELDAILLTAAVLFFMEFVMTVLTDASYIGSFYFFTDFIGTITIVFDIACILGKSAEDVVTHQEGSNEGAQMIVIRAARAARLGARAGRISRLIKYLALLPGLKKSWQSKVQQNDKGVLGQHQLNNIIAGRVAAMTILLAVAIPFLGIITYPRDDNSMMMWVQQVERVCGASSANVGAPCGVDALNSTMQQVSKFYVSKEVGYGPFEVCLAAEASGGFSCYDWLQSPGGNWNRPERRAFIREFDSSDASVRVRFDFREIEKLTSVLNILLIFLVISAMCGAALWMSSAVSKLAIEPLNRMMNQVSETSRKLFTTVETSTQNLEEILDEAEGNMNQYDVQAGFMNSPAVKSLHKTLQRLARMAELSIKRPQKAHDTADMGDEDIGILNMVGETNTKPTELRQSSQENLGSPELWGKARTSIRGKVTTQAHARRQLHEIGFEEDDIDTFGFNCMEVDPVRQGALAQWFVMNSPGGRRWAQEKIHASHLTVFIARLQEQYEDVPYHNWSHALDVAFTVYLMQRVAGVETFLSQMEQTILIISGIAHDVGHPGVNNIYLVQTQHNLAIRYNDKSPLENMHCSKLFEVAREADADIFKGCSTSEYKEARKLAIDAILHTDLVEHFSMVKELNVLYQMHGEFDSEEQEDLNSSDKTLLMNLLVHSADISNPTKPWHICRSWALVALEEFFAQGDKEKELGIPVGALNDRDAVSVPQSQIGFSEFIVAPLVAVQFQLFPATSELCENICQNLHEWVQVWITEASPNEEELKKIQGRVQKVENTFGEDFVGGDRTLIG